MHWWAVFIAQSGGNLVAVNTERHKLQFSLFRGGGTPLYRNYSEVCRVPRRRALIYLQL